MTRSYLKLYVEGYKNHKWCSLILAKVYCISAILLKIYFITEASKSFFQTPDGQVRGREPLNFVLSL